jgi:PhoPQ-activated pathogenicity-related protein
MTAFPRLFLWTTVLLLSLLPGRVRVLAGALEDYVGKPDPTFAWNEVGSATADGFTVATLELVSQQWREHVWKHNVLVVKPDTIRNPDIAFLFVTGNSSGKSSVPMLQILARRAGAIAAVVTHVPNQPLYDGRKEDALIAYTFDQYLKTGDASWPLLFPMAKSAVKAMDAIQAHAREGSGQDVTRFVVGGASKRGWTTWLAGAVDGRIKAIAPMVIDMLNMKSQLEWADKVYGKQSEQIHDYTDLNLHMKMDDPPMKNLRGWVDPYSYRDRYTMPKLLLLGTNDPYWTVDSLRHYWDSLPPPKLIFQTPNAGHDLAGGKEATQTLAAFFQMIADRQELPAMDWAFANGADGKVDVRFSINREAEKINLWTAESSDRDFRNDAWAHETLPIRSGSSTARARVNPPSHGHRAYLVEVELKTSTGETYKLSTEARVTPDTAP